jgi:hypothetical protein
MENANRQFARIAQNYAVRLSEFVRKGIKRLINEDRFRRIALRVHVATLYSMSKQIGTGGVAAKLLGVSRLTLARYLRGMAQK